MAARQCPPGVICFGTVSFAVLVLAVLALGALYMYDGDGGGDGDGDRDDGDSDDEVAAITQVRRARRRNYSRPAVGRYPARQPYPVGPQYPMMRPPPRDAFWQQVGFLSRGERGLILPLAGRELHPGRDMWQYYATSDQQNSVRLPVSSRGRSCSGEYGCQSLMNGDKVYVDGYNSLFTVTLYERTGPQYSPYV
jgi:hypothetical protein